MGDVSKNPPKFSSSKDYQSYKRELLTWTKVTKTEKKNWGNVIALSLPEGDPSDIRRKVFAAVELDTDAGYDALVKFLDDEFDKDSTQDTCEKIRELVNHKKEQGMTMKAYISGFDAKYILAQKAGLTDLPQEYLMFHIMENCLLSKNDYRLVLSSIDLEKKDTLYKQAKSALVKYFASVKHELSQEDEKVSTLLDHHDCKLETSDTLFANGANYPYRSPGPGPGQNKFKPRGFNQQPWRNPRPNNPVQRPKISKPLNGYDRDGNVLLCNSCGSYRHLQKDCPDRYETYMNMEDGVNQGETKEHEEEAQGEEQFTGFATFDVFNTMVGRIDPQEVFASVIIDTGCIKTVAGRRWFEEFCQTLSPETKQAISSEASNRVFKFGGQMKRRSLGFYSVPCSIGNKNIILKLDIVDCDIPCLISKEAMKRAGV